jgi:hypothetical protein
VYNARGEKKEERRHSIAEAWRRICHYHFSSTVRTCILQMGQDEIVSIGILLQLKKQFGGKSIRHRSRSQILTSHMV